jgi:hypothetical protein
MELNINELDDNKYDEMPEDIPIKVVNKKVVRFNKPKISYDDILSKMGMFVSDGQLHLTNEEPRQQQQQPRQQQPRQQQQQQNINPISTPQNSYIYNKYFSNEMKNTNAGPRVPKTLQEYRNMLVQDIIQRRRIRQIKSTKLIMPNSNINFAPYSSQNMNKLFSFSNK